MLGSVQQFIQQIVSLCLFKTKPQDLPASQNILMATALAAAISYFVTDAVYQHTGVRLGFAIAQVVLFGVVVWIVLRMRGHSERWMQSMIALYGAGALLQIIGWPLTNWFMEHKDGQQISGLPILFILILGFWFLAVMAHVLKHALETTTLASLGLAFVCQLVVVVFVMFLFGNAVPTS